MIRLLLVDDQTLIVEGLAVMLSLEADFQVVGTADNGQTAIEQVAALEPDVVLMDIRMPVMDGREAARILSQQFPKVKVLVPNISQTSRKLIESNFCRSTSLRSYS